MSARSQLRLTAFEKARCCAAGLLIALSPAWALSSPQGAANPQTAAPPQAPVAPTVVADAQPDTSAKQVRASDRRRAARLFMDGSKAYEKEQFEDALEAYRKAAELDPGNRNYSLAVEVAKSHEVTALIQEAARDRVRGDASAERAVLDQALALDPKNIQVTEHLHELGDDAARAVTQPLYGQDQDLIGGPLEIEPTGGVQSFHLKSDQRQVINQVFKAFGIQPTLDDSVRYNQVRFDIDDATFPMAMRALGLVTGTFYVPLDVHRALVARDTRENRRQFERRNLETIYLPGLSQAEVTEVGTLARSVFDLQQAVLDPVASTITVRADQRTLDAFNITLRDLIDGHNQVVLDVDLIQLAHTTDRNTGIQPPQTISAFNVYAEEQSILNANQSLVQQIISSGLASAGDKLAIIAILIASGQVSNTFLSQGVALFGGGITQSALSPGPATAHLNVNTSDSKLLDHIVLRLADGTTAGSNASAGTIRSGTKYPIQTSSFSSLGGSIPNIPGLTGAGSSSSLTSLLGNLGSSVPNVPQIQYQDLGLTLKATPRVMRNDDVALTIDMKIDALAGTSVNGNPVLTNRAYSGVVTLKEGEGVVVVSELDKQESRAISGFPGISEIPGLNNASDNDRQRSNSTLLIVMTPHVVRSPKGAGHSPMLRISRTSSVQ